MQALVVEAERRGYSVKEGGRSDRDQWSDVCIAIDGHEFALAVVEKDDRLRVWLPHVYGGRRQWNDGVRLSIESKLGGVLEEIESRAALAEARRLQREAEELAREKAWERQMESAKGAFAEAFRATALDEQVRRWQFARDIRRYCRLLRAVWTDKDQVADLRSWIEWAESHADQIDPVRHPDVPSPPEPSAEELRPYMRGLSPFGSGSMW